MFRLSFYPVFDSYALVAVVALALAGLMLFGPSREKTGRWGRLAIALLRTIVILLVLAAMLRPTLIYTETKKQPATLVVLADQSRSMSVPDAVKNKTRWDALRGAVSDSASELARLQRDFELKAYAFDAQVHEVPAESGKIDLSEKPEGPQTAIGAAIDDVLRRQAGKRLLGILLLSDGSQRAYAPRDLPAQTAAARLKALGYKLYTFPFGQSRGLGDAKDVAVKDLVTSPSVFVKNELTVHGEIRVDGYVDTKIPVRLLFETSPGKMEVVAEQTVTANADGQLLPVDFSYVPEVAGEHKLTLEAVQQPGELVIGNNQLSTFVNVLKGGVNVLYIEGALRVELRDIRRALESSREIKVDYVPLNLRNKENRPADFSQRFKPGKYDVYIFGDVDSTAFKEGELDDLEKTVRRGAGFMMLGGFQSFGAGGYYDTPLAKLLPVHMDRLERQRPDEPPRTDVHWPGPLKMRPTKLGLMHFALILSNDRADNAAVWEKLPPLDGANKLHDVAPGAAVLADAGEDKPLLVAQTIDNGRIMAFAGDTTWRWRMNKFASAHSRFWRQIILWLARKDQSQEGNVWVRLNERRLTPSQRVEFTAGATSPNGDTIADGQYKAEIVLPDGARRPLTLLRKDEQMAGSFNDTQLPGDYTIEVTASQKGQALGMAKARFTVIEQDIELDNASADVATMQSLAATTGGESLAPEELPKLVRRLAEDTANLEVQQETKKTFWDTWAFFLTIVVLLGLEWYLRKRWGLV
jgi:uncharacterized membrane protein